MQELIRSEKEIDRSVKRDISAMRVCATSIGLAVPTGLAIFAIGIEDLKVVVGVPLVMLVVSALVQIIILDRNVQNSLSEKVLGYEADYAEPDMRQVN